MFKMEYRIGNRKVSQREWERHIAEAPLEGLKDRIRQRVRNVRCPKHGTTPNVTFTKTSSGFDAKVSGCCDKVVEAAQRALR